MTCNKAAWVRAVWDGGIGRAQDDVMVGRDGDKVVIHRLRNPSERLIFEKKDWARLVRIVGVAAAQDDDGAPGV